MTMPVQLTIGVAAVIVAYLGRHILGGAFGLYKIVPVNEAHIRILQNSKMIFSSRHGKSAYWVVPFITKLHKLPLCNLAIPVNDIKLNDKNMAKFVSDIMCFININNIDLAVERLILTDTEKELGFDFVKLSEDLRAIMESVGRTVTTKQTILDIYMNRQLLDQAITKEVEVVFPKWGIELVDLELKDIKDAPGSTIIADIERKVASEIRRDAEIRVATTTKEAELIKAEAEEIYRKRQIEKDKQIGMAEQFKNHEISIKEAEANFQKIEAMRKFEVGQAEIEKQRMEQLAMGQKLKYSIEAEGQANQIQNVGKAEANIIQIKKEADAAGTLKLAEALKQFNDVAINVKILDVQKEIMIAKFNALGQAIQKADVKWIMSGTNAQKFFGINLDAEGGANIKQFIEESGLDIEKLKEMLTLNRKEGGKV
ncbi:MAG: SPFH domain-containing protein [Candidatus Omnitrophica bacterium]|nr:SPFH domain-containing protein [Candidatus Omnitrophota bacterium]